MLTDGNHKPGSVKMGYFALRFLFTNIYHKEWAKEYLPTPKIAKTLPLVLSKDEVADVLGAIENFKHRTIIMLIYSTGARVSESVNIKNRKVMYGLLFKAVSQTLLELTRM
jgi:site-specific recombinase XerD